MEENDENLINQYLEGDQESLKVLIESYTSSVYNFSARFVGIDNASDITQEVFIKVWKNLKKFNSAKANFKTWIFTIARNTIFDYLRKKKTIVFSNLDNEETTFSETLKDENILPSEALQKLQDAELLNSILEKLPEQYKAVLVLYYQEEMTFSEISQVLNKPLNTVKSHHRRAILKIRENIEKLK